MFKKFEVIYARNQQGMEKSLLPDGQAKYMKPQDVSEILEDIERLNLSMPKSKKVKRWVVKFEVTTLWFFKKTHKLYLRSRSENGAIAQAKKFALGEK